MAYHRSARTLAGGLLALLFGLAGRAHAVDEVIEINQARATKGGITPGDMPGFPITISTGPLFAQPMSFKLTGPLFISTTDNVIDIQSPFVTIDLNGFMITGTCAMPPCMGTAILSTQDSITVMNGTVRGFAAGVDLSGSSARIENMHAFANTLGLRASNYCIVRNNVSSSNTEDGIRTGPGCTIVGNTTGGNGADGIQSGSGCNVIENTARNNMGFGLKLATTTGYSHNVLTNNMMGNVDSGVSGGGNLCDGAACP